MEGKIKALSLCQCLFTHVWDTCLKRNFDSVGGRTLVGGDMGRKIKALRVVLLVIYYYS
jgi:hypothetical protein